MRQRGFSLIELMVTVTVMVLLMLLAMPSLGTWLDNTRIRNEGDSIMTGLQSARSAAVSSNQNVSFWLVTSATSPGNPGDDCTLSGSGGSWVVSVASPLHNCASGLTSTTAPILLSRGMGSDSARVSVAAVQSDGTTAATTVTFNGFGRIVGASPIAQITLNGTGGGTYRQLRVMVSSTGAVRMCDVLVTSSTDPRKC